MTPVLCSVPLEVLLDPCRTWCPSSTCQAVCQLKEVDPPALPQLVQCAVCALEFCSACKSNWHPGQACQENNLPIASFLPGENRYCRFYQVTVTFSQFLWTDGSYFCILTSTYLLNSDWHIHTSRSSGDVWRCWAFIESSVKMYLQLF